MFADGITRRNSRAKAGTPKTEVSEKEKNANVKKTTMLVNT